MSIVKYLFRVILLGFVFMVMRSPFAMTLVGFTAGISAYHYFPDQTYRGIAYIENGVHHILSGESLPEQVSYNQEGREEQESGAAQDTMDAFKRTVGGM